MASDVFIFLRRHRFAVAAGTIIVVGIAWRLALTALGWPHSNSEEGTMGLEAMHILLRGERPVYFYGQNYMGVGEAYAGAIAFWLFGISVFSLRLGMIAFDTVFFVSVCWLASQLYSRRVALVTLVPVVVAWPFLLRCELLADGGKPETLATSALMFALASWLALTRPVGPQSRGQRWLRYTAFAAWGLVAGFGLYTYLIVAPFVVASALLLWLTCRRELRGWALAFACGGLFVGFLPAIIYAAALPSTGNPIEVFRHVFLHGSTNRNSIGFGWHGWHILVEQVEAPLLYTLPQITGLIMPYTLQNVPFYGPLSPATITAVILGGTWSLVYLSLLALGTLRPLQALYPHKRWGIIGSGVRDGQKRAITEDRSRVRNIARLMLALAAWLTIAAYIVSPVGAYNPTTGRYLIGLTTALPVVLWPLVEAMQRVRLPRELLRAPSRELLRVAWAPAIVLLLSLALAGDTVNLVQQIPAVMTVNQQDAKFDSDLLRYGITRMYSDYWTCDRVIFATHERIICSDTVQYQASRYTPYDAIVAADPQAKYVLPQGSSVERHFVARMAAHQQQYVMQPLDGYDIYTLEPSSA
jgi:hypothetical protein